MSTEQSSIERQVMASVGVIYTARRLFSASALKMYVLAGSILALWKLLWVSKVLENFLLVEKHGISAIGNYLLSAVGHANLAVDAIVLVASLAFISLVVDMVRTSSNPRSTWA